MQCVDMCSHRMWCNRLITQKAALTLLLALREDVSFSSLAVFLSSPTPFLHFSPKTNGPSPLSVLFPPSFHTHTVPVKLMFFLTELHKHSLIVPQCLLKESDYEEKPCCRQWESRSVEELFYTPTEKLMTFTQRPLIAQSRQNYGMLPGMTMA